MTTTNDKEHNRDRLAHEFTRILKEWLGADWAEMVARNAAEPADSDICHSHDYCDANMAMAEAFQKVHEREPLTPAEMDWRAGVTQEVIDADLALMNAAWDEAQRIWQAEPTLASLCAKYRFHETGTGGGCTALTQQGEVFHWLLTETDDPSSPDRVDAECALGLYRNDQDHSEAQATFIFPDVESAMKMAGWFDETNSNAGKGGVS